MINVVGIKLNNQKKTYYFLSESINLKKQMNVIVDTEKGLEFGQVVADRISIDDSELKSPLKDVLRIATKDDCYKQKKNLNDEKLALVETKKAIEHLKLNMFLVDAHYTFDRQQLIFRFFSDERIDFRNLAKELASKYKTRIELRQIGARDKAKEIGGCGQCGRTLCCSQFLFDIDSVSINMAKNQGIALNPSKINGSCGRLLCCLKYENENYCQYKKELPKIGEMIKLEGQTGKVVSIDVLNKSFVVDIGHNNLIEVKK